MDFYKNKQNVESYIRFTPHHDGSELIHLLEGVLPRGSTVLELGMGPGKDFDLLTDMFAVTGSDTSQEFLDLYRKRSEGADLMLLDALTLDTDRRFDCIYSTGCRRMNRFSFSHEAISGEEVRRLGGSLLTL